MISRAAWAQDARFAGPRSRRRTTSNCATHFTFCQSYEEVEDCMVSRARRLLDASAPSSDKVVIGIAGTPGVIQSNRPRHDAAFSASIILSTYWRCDHHDDRTRDWREASMLDCARMHAGSGKTTMSDRLVERCTSNYNCCRLMLWPTKIL